MSFFYSARSTPVNAVLGDQGFLNSYGRPPLPGWDSEEMRIRAHLHYVCGCLGSGTLPAEAGNCVEPQLVNGGGSGPVEPQEGFSGNRNEKILQKLTQQNRARLLEVLNDYALTGELPRNTEPMSAGERTPIFL